MKTNQIKTQDNNNTIKHLSPKKAGEKLPFDSVVINQLSDDQEAFFTNIGELRQKSLQKESKTEEAETEFKSGFIDDYLDAEQVDEKVLELSEKFPELVEVHTRDYETSGYDGKEKDLQGPAPLRYMRIGKKTPDRNDKPGVLLAASPHAREMMQPITMLETTQQLLENYNHDSRDPKVREITKLVDNTDIYIVAVSNPDGLNYAVHDDKKWRKNRRDLTGGISDEIAQNVAQNIASKESEEDIRNMAQQIKYEINDTIGCGVDVNRNYDYKWKETDPSSDIYSGSHPFSEPETRHIKEIVDDHPNIKFIADFHSYSEEIRRPIKIKDEEKLENYIEYQQRMKDAVKNVRGKSYRIIESRVVNGTSDDYFHFKKDKYAFVIESGTYFKPKLPEALKVVEENTELAKELIRITDDYRE
jgi:hypothetical protein